MLMAILPNPPSGTPSSLAQDGIEFFGLWISRIGGLVAFIGAVKFALSVHADDVKDQLQSLFTMVAGFMIQVAVNDLGIFNIPSVYSDASANLEFQSIMNFIGAWSRRVGAVGSLLGALVFALAIKDNNASAKINGLKALTTGAMIVGISGMLSSFV